MNEQIIRVCSSLAQSRLVGERHGIAAGRRQVVPRVVVNEGELEDKERSGSRAVPVMVAAGECLESTEKKPRQARVRMPASPVCFG
jgi:cysteine sulfinate desulfinase/cysteine desulfurase-like protein